MCLSWTSTPAQHTTQFAEVYNILGMLCSTWDHWVLIKRHLTWLKTFIFSSIKTYFKSHQSDWCRMPILKILRYQVNALLSFQCSEFLGNSCHESETLMTGEYFRSISLQIYKPHNRKIIHLSYTLFSSCNQGFLHCCTDMTYLISQHSNHQLLGSSTLVT